MTRLRRRWGWVLSLAAPACAPKGYSPSSIGGPGEDGSSSGASTGSVTLSGRLLDADGSPVPGVELVLDRGLAADTHYDCAVIGLVASSSNLARATTGADGRFAIALKSSERIASYSGSGGVTITPGGGANPEGIACFSLHSTPGASGRQVEADFAFRDTMALPDLPWFDARMAVDDGADPITARFHAPASLPPASTLSLVLQVGDPASTNPLWEVPLAGGAASAPVPRYLLEDHAPTYRLELRSTGSAGGSPVYLRSLSEGVAGTWAGPPAPSRGASCSADQPFASGGSTCPLTDGDLAFDAFNAPGASAVTLRLAQAARPTHALLRVLQATGGSLQLEAAPDGTSFSVVGTTDAATPVGFVDLPITSPVSASTFRLTLQGGTLTGLGELSLVASP